MLRLLSITHNGDSYLGLPSPDSKQLINFQSQVWERIQLSIHVWIFAPIAKKLSFRSISISCHSQENAWREWREKNMCEFVNFRRPSFLKDIFLKSKWVRTVRKKLGNVCLNLLLFDSLVVVTQLCLCQAVQHFSDSTTFDKSWHMTICISRSCDILFFSSIAP